MSQSSISAQQNELFEQAQRALQESEDFFANHGLDPEKAKAFFESKMTPEMRAQAKAEFEADMRAIEQDVREQMAANNSNSPNKRPTPRTRRPMI